MTDQSGGVAYGSPGGGPLSENTNIQYSDALLQRKTDFDSLPANIKSSVQDYWRRNPEALSPQITQQQLDELNKKRQAAMQQTQGEGPISWALTPVEYLGSKAYWVYSHTVSP